MMEEEETGKKERCDRKGEEEEDEENCTVRKHEQGGKAEKDVAHVCVCASNAHAGVCV